MQKHRHLSMLLAGAAVLALAALMEIRSSDISLFRYRLPDVCVFHEASGRQCPGCGLTRSVVAAGHLDLAGSVRFHPAGWIVFLLLCLHLPYRMARLSSHCRDSSPVVAWSTNIMRGGLVVVLAAGIIRALL